MKRVAFLAAPSWYGLFSVYLNLRKGLADRGVDLRWLAAGAAARRYADIAGLDRFRACGELLEPDCDDERRSGRALHDRLASGDFDAFVVNPPQRRFEMNQPRYLPDSLPRIMVLHNVAHGVYRVGRALREHVHATVAISPRIAADAVSRYGFAADRVTTIPHAVDTEPFLAVERAAASGPLRLLSFGRLEAKQKGLFWWPAILDKLGNLDWTLTVAGEGVDGAALEQRLARFGPRVRFVGRVEREGVPRLVASHDVFVMPSRTEGFGYTIIESMAGGCVPIVSHIRQVTDFVVEEGETGLLFPIGDTAQAARLIRELAADPTRLEAMSLRGRARAEERFGVRAMGESYGRLLREVTADPPAIAPSLPIDRWFYPPEFQPSRLGRWVPAGIKQRLRALKNQ